jgi:hypothetical protein
MSRDSRHSESLVHPTRSDNPAAVLRALLSRLPARPPSPTKSSSEQERESDFDTISESNAAPSIAQESLKQIFSNVLRDPGNTPKPPGRWVSTPKIRVLDAFGREQDPDESHVEDAEAAATPSHSTVSRAELLSRIRNGLDDLVVGIDDLDK